MKKGKIQFNGKLQILFLEKKLVIADTKESRVDEMNQFSFETKMRKMVLDLVQPYIIDSTNTMVEIKNEQSSLLSRVNLLEKRLNKLKKDTIVVRLF